MIYAVIAIYLGMHLIFASAKTFQFDTPFWDTMYFWFQDTAGAGWLVWYLLYLREKPYRSIILPILIFAIIIFVWDVISYTTGIGVAYQIETAVAFGLGVLILIYFIVKDLRERWKSKRS